MKSDALISLERDLQLVVQLNPKISVGKTIYGDSNWISFISGHWSARWGKGTVCLFRDDLFGIANEHAGRAWRTREATRCSRPVDSRRFQFYPTDSRSPASVRHGPLRGLARRPPRRTREAQRPSNRRHDRSEVILVQNLSAHGDGRLPLPPSQHWHVDRKWNQTIFGRYIRFLQSHVVCVDEHVSLLPRLPAFGNIGSFGAICVFTRLGRTGVSGFDGL